MNKTIFTHTFLFVLATSFFIVSCKSSSDTSDTFSLQSTVTPANAGSVSPSGGSFDSGEQVQITATPNQNFLFREWNGDLTSTNNPASVTINKNMSINALFEELTYPLTVEVEGQGEVSEQIVNAKTDYTEGTTVQLTAEPADGWEFVSWSGDLDGSENPATIMMDEEKTIMATFETTSNTYPLTVNIDGNGEVSEEIVTSKTTDYNEGTMVELTAEPADEWRFVEWSGDLEGSENPATITVDEPKTVNALFEFGFNENFEDGEAQNWLFSDNEFSIEDGQLQYFIESGVNHGSAYYDQKFRNFKVETRASQDSQNEEGIFVIYVRSTGFLVEDEDNEIFSLGYFMAMNANGVLIAKAEQIGGEVVANLLYEVEMDLSYGENNYHTLAINANGSNFDFFLDGNHIHSFLDNTFSEAGYITIATVNTEDDRNYQTSWEYVRVLPPDPPMNN